MEALAETLGSGPLAALLGLPGGIVLGLAARRARFCTLGTIESALYGGDYAGLRMWAMALGMGILTAGTMAAAGMFSPAEAFFLQLRWNPLASVIGGLMFGYGMAMAGNCGFGALARLGGGDLRSFVVVGVIGVSAAAAAGGPLAPLRAALFPAVPLDPGETPASLPASLGLPPLIAAGLVGLPLLVWALSDAAFREERRRALWSGAAGIAIGAAWGLSGMLREVDFGQTQLASYSFAGPVGDSILWLMTASGGGMDFGLGSVAGVWIGALIGSRQGGEFRWEACEDPTELSRQIMGAALMGVGAVIAMGCSVGMGLSAFALLHWGAPATLVSIALGAALGLRQLIRGFHAI